MTWPRPTNLHASCASALAGEPEAWPRLIARFERLLRDIGRQYRLAPADVEDAMQTTWLQLFRKLSTIRAHAALPAWLATTMRRECLRALQKPMTEVLVDEPVAAGEHAPDPLGGLLAAERREALREALAKLPQRHRRPDAAPDRGPGAAVTPRSGSGSGCRSAASARSARARWCGSSATRGFAAYTPPETRSAHRERELAARADAELAVDAREVGLDRLRAEEEVRGGLLVRRPAGDAAGDLLLLVREPVAVALRAARDALPGPGQLAPGALRPGLRAERLEAGERLPELRACVDPPPRAAQPLAVTEAGARELEGHIVGVTREGPKAASMSASSARTPR